MLYVAVETGDRRRAGARAGTGAAPAPAAPSAAGRALTCARAAAFSIAPRWRCGRGRCWPACTVGPELRAPAAADAAAVPLRRRRRPGAVARRSPVVAGVRRSRRCRRCCARRSRTTSICGPRSARVEEARAPRRHREVVPLSAGRRHRRLQRADSRRPPRRRTAGDNDDKTLQSGTFGIQLSWEIDLFGRIRREQRGGGGDRCWPASRGAAACW